MNLTPSFIIEPFLQRLILLQEQQANTSKKRMLPFKFREASMRRSSLFRSNDSVSKTVGIAKTKVFYAHLMVIRSSPALTFPPSFTRT